MIDVIEQEKILIDFSHKLTDGMVDLEPEISKTISERFWELV